MGASVANVTSYLTTFAITSAVAYAGALAAIGKAGVSASLEYGRFTATIGGALGSLEKGKDVMSALADYAVPSAFNLTDLAQAATQLVAAGMNLREVLPVAERFALAIGGTDPQGLMQVDGALARLKGGSFGEAMEIFRRAGVSAGDLRAQGITVDKGGQIQGSPTEVMAAITRISEGRPKAMADALMGTAGVKVSGLMDSFGKALRSVGDAALVGLVPVIEKWTAALNDGVASGLFDQLGSAMSSLIAVIGGVDVKSSLVGAVTFASATIQTFAEMLDALSGKNSSDEVKQFVDPFATTSNWAEDWLNVLTGPGQLWSANKFIKEAEQPLEAASRMQFGKPKKKGDALNTALGAEEPVAAVKAVSYLAQIADNTKLTKQDLRRLAFGAGAAEAGVTPVEMSAARRKRASGEMGGEIGQIIQKYFDNYIHQWMKQQGYAR